VRTKAELSDLLDKRDLPKTGTDAGQAQVGIPGVITQPHWQRLPCRDPGLQAADRHG
jgi:hypothetical protein